MSGPTSRAEQIALWNLTAILEAEVDEAFSSSYGDAVRAASARLEGDA